MLKIWGRNTSSNVQKAMFAIGELKLAHERIDIGGAFGKNKEPAYLAMNPNGLVPTLEETMAFCCGSQTPSFDISPPGTAPARWNRRIRMRVRSPINGWIGNSQCSALP